MILNKASRIALTCMAAALFASCKEEKKESSSTTFTVNGTVKGLDPEYMIYYYKDKNNSTILDTIWIKDGSFTYTTELEQTKMINFYPNMEKVIKKIDARSSLPSKASRFSFIATPGETIEVKGEISDFVDAYPSGNQENDDLAKLHQQIYPLMNDYVNTRLQVVKLKDKDSVNEELVEKTKKLSKQVHAIKSEFIKNNPGSVVSAYYLSDMMLRRELSDDDALNFYENLSSELATNTFYKEVEARAAGIKATRAGEDVPKIEAVNVIDNSNFKIESLKGKYVLIDFWGTWCGPCVAEMPEIKEISHKYKDKLVVIGINNGDSKERLLDFVSGKGYDWPQLMDKQPDETFTTTFNVAGFPTKFIIDPDGKIVQRYIGGGEEVFEKLDELLR